MLLAPAIHHFGTVSADGGNGGSAAGAGSGSGGGGGGGRVILESLVDHQSSPRLHQTLAVLAALERAGYLLVKPVGTG